MASWRHRNVDFYRYFLLVICIAFIAKRSYCPSPKHIQFCDLLVIINIRSTLLGKKVSNCRFWVRLCKVVNNKWALHMYCTLWYILVSLILTRTPSTLRKNLRSKKKPPCMTRWNQSESKINVISRTLGCLAFFEINWLRWPPSSLLFRHSLDLSCDEPK